MRNLSLYSGLIFFSLLQKLAHDLRMTLSPSYEDILSRLVAFLPRRISADALTALLASFSALFKHVLIPAGESKLVEQTWSRFKEVLPKCNAEVQRATAEVWGTTLRKFKLPVRATLVQLLASDITQIEDTCAWIFAIACKVRSPVFQNSTQKLTLNSLSHKAFTPRLHQSSLRW